MNYSNAAYIPYEWSPDDVILDLYQVQKVSEGYGSNAKILPFHEGGFGIVYKVWHRSWNRHMAVKTPKPGLFLTPEQKDVFIKECETWINLGLHPHIASCHYVRELGGVPRLFSEYADAGNLSEWIKSHRLYAGDQNTILDRVLDLSIQFASGLHYANESGVIHQDVKSLNALMWEDGTLKVTDFGIGSKRHHTREIEKSELSQTLMVTAGSMSLSHCSPEQRAGKKLDRRTDIWSWAVCVLEMFNGGVTWLSGSVADRSLCAYLEHGPSLERIPRIPDAMIPLLRKCFSVDPSERPKTLAECTDVIREIYKQSLHCEYPRPEAPVVMHSSESINNRAISLIDLGRDDEADFLFKQATQKDPENRSIAYNYNLFKWRNKSIAANEFVNCLNKSSNSNINGVVSLLEEGLIDFELGFFNSSRETLRQMSETHEIASSVASQITNQTIKNDTIINLRLSTKEFIGINNIKFSPMNGNIHLLGDIVYNFNYINETACKVLSLDDEVEWINFLKRSRSYVARNKNSSKLILWNPDAHSSINIIEVKGKVMNVFETHDPKFIIATISYSDPNNFFASPVLKIQKFEICNGVLSDELYYGSFLNTVSENGEIIVVLTKMQYGYSPFKIQVWNGRDDKTLIELDYPHATNGPATVVDQKTMRMFCSIADEPGISVIDLKNGFEVTQFAKDLGLVGYLEIANDGDLLLVHSRIEIEGIDVEQVSVCNYNTYSVVTILMRGKNIFSSSYFCWSDFSQGGLIAVREIATGILTVFQNFASGRAPYLYMEDSSYRQSQEMYLKYKAMIRAAEMEWNLGYYLVALRILRKARRIPSYFRHQEALHLWRKIGSVMPKSGVKYFLKIGVFSPKSNTESITFSNNGYMHPDGNDIVLRCNVRDHKNRQSYNKIIMVDTVTSNVKTLFQGEKEKNEFSGFVFLYGNNKSLALIGDTKSQFVTVLGISDFSYRDFDRGDYSFDRPGGDCSFAMSQDGSWIALGLSWLNVGVPKELRAEQPPTVSIWDVASTKRSEVDFDPRTEYATNLYFCRHQGLPALVFYSNLGIQVCSVDRCFERIVIGRLGRTAILSVSSCGSFVAHACGLFPPDNSTVIEVYELASDAECIFSMQVDGKIRSILLTRHGEMLVALFENEIRIYSVTTKIQIFTNLIEGDEFVRMTSFSRDENKICVVGYKMFAMYEIDWDY